MPSSSALLIIDMQANIYAAPAAHGVEALARRLDELAARARASGVAVIFVQHEEAGSDWERGSAGWQFHPRLAPKPSDIVVAKRSCDSFRQTDLVDILTARGITRLVIGGYATDFCVDTTLRAAVSREIATAVLADGHTCRDRPHLAADGVIAYHNWIWSRLDAPGNPIAMTTIDTVTWAAP